MLTCREVSEKAQDYTDGNSSVWMRMRIRLHLLMCRNCTGFVDQTSKTKQLISESLSRDTQAEPAADMLAAFQQRGSETPVDKSAHEGIGKGKSEIDL